VSAVVRGVLSAVMLCCVVLDVPGLSQVCGQRTVREAEVRESGSLGLGWARTKVNMAIFRHSAVDSFGDRQVAGWYDGEGRVCLGERRLGESVWRVEVTDLRGRVTDAHNVISLAFDGAGGLHMSWDHHGDPLRYMRVSAGGGLSSGERGVMLGRDEERVTYPEFYRLPGGDLLFFYRDGASGAGNLVLNRYRLLPSGVGEWQRVQSNLIDGEGERNAYWQACADGSGVIHLSWVWRETPDVVTNHDLCYARSADGGVTWTNSAGVRLSVPLTQSGSEYAFRIAQGSELANQTSMSVDGAGRPVIATFWRAAEAGAVPQYRLVYLSESGWRMVQVGERTLNFERRGGGTKRPPISRPLLLLGGAEGSRRAVVLFRDEELGGGVTAAVASDYELGDWQYWRLSERVGQADPLVDFAVWRERGEVHLLSQLTGQGDGEREESVLPTAVRLLEWRVVWPSAE